MIDFNFSLSYIEIYLIFVNIATFLLYGTDKLQSIRNGKSISRVPEINLLLMTLLGGTIGSTIAMIIFRHKIKKLSFIVKYFLVVIVQAGGVYFLYEFYLK